jgi:DNA primase
MSDRKITEVYPYYAADGTNLYAKIRYEPKDFSFRTASGATSLKGVPRVLYRLVELLDDTNAAIYLCEGEKDADNLPNKLGVITTTPDSDKWNPDLVEPLRGRSVIILRDMDAAGEARALKAAKAVHEVAADVRIVCLPGLTGEETPRT